MKIYNKLVRDKIPSIIRERSGVPVSRELVGREYIDALNKKLSEEVSEYLDPDNNVEELADIVEVIYAILKHKNVTLEEFEDIRKEKVSKRGAFDKKIFLEYVE